MSEALPTIRVTDSQNQDGSPAGGGLDSPSSATDGGQTARPKSQTSSEGNLAYPVTLYVYAGSGAWG